VRAAAQGIYYGSPSDKENLQGRKVTCFPRTLKCRKSISDLESSAR